MSDDARGGSEDRVVARPSATFKPRRRGLSPKRQAEFDRWIERWGLTATGPRLDFDDLFENLGDHRAPVLDIGFGHGESTLEMARLNPSEPVIGVDVHTPGVVTLLDAIEHEPLPHVRVVHGDVLRFLARVPSRSLAGVRIFFPDPWPKARHHHRRLVRRDVVEVLVDRLVIGGRLHLATDIADYAEGMKAACDVAELVGGVIERPGWRPLTRYERRGLEEGRTVTDLLYDVVDPD